MACDPTLVDPGTDETEEPITASDYPAIEAAFGGAIDMENLPNYANQAVPNYITNDNTDDNVITDAGATLGRVLFYDKNLSENGTVACASCHQQQFAFGDALQASEGANGTTGRHSMRLINARFASEARFFWDERAATLEEQTTMPIQDHTEMGFSGENGDPGIEDLADRLEEIGYYQELFAYVFGDAEVTEERMQIALAQFVRSIQSFDSKFDAGRSRSNNDRNNFANFTAEENLGKQLFLTPPQLDNNGLRTGGGFGCQGCHEAPEFDIDPNSRNNGFTSSFTGVEDETITRSPTLRDLFDAEGNLNGGMMHTGELTSIEAVLAHYGNIDPRGNGNLDRRLANRGAGQTFTLDPAEVNALEAFMKTLSGTDVYTNAKWSDPFPN